MRTHAWSGVVDLRWEAHDRHPTTTRLTMVGVPLVVLLAVVGLPSVDIHEPLHYLGVMGPTCGMTRGVMWAARGEFVRALQFNPASVLVLPSLVLLTGRAVYGRLTNRWLNLNIRWRRWLWMIPALLILVLWLRQQLSADFLLAYPAG